MRAKRDWKWGNLVGGRGLEPLLAASNEYERVRTDR